MLIVLWNCGGALRNKFSAFQDLLPDVSIIQECEDPSRSTSDEFRKWASNHLWVGDNKNRGLGVFAKPHISIEPDELQSDGLQTFLPCRIQRSVLLIGVWTRQTESYDYRYIGQLWKYLQLHKAALEANTSLVMGDLNSNVIWDRRHSVAKHSDVVRELANIGLESAYHRVRSVPQGKEPDPTFFLQRDLKKPYHIDYAFIPAAWLQSCTVEIGDSTHWLKYSDHMPLRVEVDDATWRLTRR
jgi:exonuclease III